MQIAERHVVAPKVPRLSSIFTRTTWPETLSSEILLTSGCVNLWASYTLAHNDIALGGATVEDHLRFPESIWVFDNIRQNSLSLWKPFLHTIPIFIICRFRATCSFSVDHPLIKLPNLPLRRLHLKHGEIGCEIIVEQKQPEIGS